MITPTAATSWASPGTLLAAASVAVALVGIVAGALMVQRVSFPPRRLTYGLLTADRILTAPDEINTDFEVRHRGVLVGDPYVAEVRLAAGGRLDIPQHRVRQRPTAAAGVHGADRGGAADRHHRGWGLGPSRLEVSGNVLAVQPCRIGRRQTTTITLIVDGPPALDCDTPLVDVDVKDAAARDASRRRTADALRVGSGILGVAAGVAYYVRRWDALVLAIPLVMSALPSAPHHRNLGVLPERRGAGIGAAMLRHKLAEADAEGTPAYLEASSPSNRALYQRHGFEPMGAPIQLPDGPSLLPMWREPAN